MKRFLFLSIGLLFTFFVACDKNDESTPNVSETGEWQIFIDGESVDLPIGHSIYYNQGFGALDYGELQIYFSNATGDQLLLDIRNYEPQNYPENEVIPKIYDTDELGANTECNEGPDGNNYCDIAYAGYSTSDSLIYDTYFHESTSPGKIEITECDAESLKVSGTFEFEVEEYIGVGDNLIIKGSFSNVPYKVLY